MFNHTPNSFTAWLIRLKNIKRWPLMHSLKPENCSMHVFEVAVIAHMIALIGVARHNRKYNPSDFMVAAIYHEASESAGLSDLPSPVKYANPDITREIKKIEHKVELSLVENALPDFLREYMRKVVIQKNVPPEIKQIVKAADDIAAYIKACEEMNLSNLEFFDAQQKLDKRLKKHCENLPEVQEFFDTQMQCCMMSLDRLTNQQELDLQ